MLAPVMLAVLNTDPAISSAVMAANVLKETLAKGGLASAPRIAMPTLGAAFVDPAVDWLGRHGCTLSTGRRLKSIVAMVRGFGADLGRWRGGRGPRCRRGAGRARMGGAGAGAGPDRAG
jgi:hypothetical protein